MDSIGVLFNLHIHSVEYQCATRDTMCAAFSSRENDSSTSLEVKKDERLCYLYLQQNEKGHQSASWSLKAGELLKIPADYFSDEKNALDTSGMAHSNP